MYLNRWCLASYLLKGYRDLGARDIPGSSGGMSVNHCLMCTQLRLNTKHRHDQVLGVVD